MTVSRSVRSSSVSRGAAEASAEVVQHQIDIDIVGLGRRDRGRTTHDANSTGYARELIMEPVNRASTVAPAAVAGVRACPWSSGMFLAHPAAIVAAHAGHAEADRRFHFGGCRPREFSHPLTCEALSAFWARRISRSRSTPGGVSRASLRSLAASSESRCLSVCMKPSRSCMALFPLFE
jgi:hypothetical protein